MSIGGLVDGATYYATYTVFNGAGNYQEMTSDGFRVDTKAPYWRVPSSRPSLALVSTKNDSSDHASVCARLPSPLIACWQWLHNGWPVV